MKRENVTDKNIKLLKDAKTKFDIAYALNNFYKDRHFDLLLDTYSKNDFIELKNKCLSEIEYILEQPKKSVVTKNQKKEFEKIIKVNGKQGKIVVEVRYDDECGNGHNTFAITGTTYTSIRNKGDRDIYESGCIHEQIAEHFPELKHLIKWHLVSSYSPIHYIANTLYHSKDREDITKEIGEPTKFAKYLKFNNCPFTFKEQSTDFWEFLSSSKVEDLYVSEVKYSGKDTYPYTPNYTLGEFSIDDWYQAPFKCKKDANEFLEALQTRGYNIVSVPIQWNNSLTPDIEAARESAIWEDATLEQLQSEQALKDRLPKLMKEFRKDIEALGFIY